MTKNIIIDRDLGIVVPNNPTDGNHNLIIVSLHSCKKRQNLCPQCRDPLDTCDHGTWVSSVPTLTTPTPAPGGDTFDSDHRSLQSRDCSNHRQIKLIFQLVAF